MDVNRIYIDTERTIGEIDPHLFGGFIEHMGRSIYQGIYDPDSPQADEEGFRRDVQAAIRELGPTVIRYPGGNFLSGYHWRDGVGPREQRPLRRDLAWKSIETNQFGTDEFIQYCRRIGAAPLLGVNLGTGSMEEAAALVEYCNAPAGCTYADMRKENGFPEPFGVEYWCLGNEMDGPWQIGHLEAGEYARKALETGRMMRMVDRNIHLTLCGSSSSGMPTFPEWDRTVLEMCWEDVDFLSMHYYAGNSENDTPSYLALAVEFERYIDTLSGLLSYVQAKRRSKHSVHLSWDEWNVWYKNHEDDGKWQTAPRLIEEVYNLEDALVVAQWLNVFLRRCGVLKMACLAQLVNVIAPILTKPDGLLKQTIYYPIQFFSQLAKGVSLDVMVKCASYTNNKFGETPLLDVSASYTAEKKNGALFIVNRELQTPVPVEVVWQNAQPAWIENIWRFGGPDPKAANTWDAPRLLTPVKLPGSTLQEGRLKLSLPPLTVTAVEISY